MKTIFRLVALATSNLFVTTLVVVLPLISTTASAQDPNQGPPEGAEFSNWEDFTFQKGFELERSGIYGGSPLESEFFVTQAREGTSRWDPQQPANSSHQVQFINAAYEGDPQADTMTFVYRNLVSNNGQFWYSTRESSRDSGANPDSTARIQGSNGRACNGIVSHYVRYRDARVDDWIMLKDSFDPRTPYPFAWRWYNDAIDQWRPFDYRVVQTDPDNCRALIFLNLALLWVQGAEFSTPLESDPQQFTTVVYPNPARSTLRVRGTGVEFQGLILVDVLGRQVARSPVPELSVAYVAPGVYTLLVATNPDVTEVHRVTVVR